MFVDLGSDVTLNCFCSNQSEGSFTGPDIQSLNGTRYSFLIPYTYGYDLNPKLDRERILIVGNFNNNECNLKIKYFSKENSGIYQCRYWIMDTFCLHEYVVTITSNYILVIL